MYIYIYISLSRGRIDKEVRNIKGKRLLKMLAIKQFVPLFLWQSLFSEQKLAGDREKTEKRRNSRRKKHHPPAPNSFSRMRGAARGGVGGRSSAILESQELYWQGAFAG